VALKKIILEKVFGWDILCIDQQMYNQTEDKMKFLKSQIEKQIGKVDHTKEVTREKKQGHKTQGRRVKRI
jgi:hypothetical protein